MAINGGDDNEFYKSGDEDSKLDQMYGMPDKAPNLLVMSIVVVVIIGSIVGLFTLIQG